MSEIRLEEQKKHFKNHIAKFTDYGNIKILDFKAPGTSDYRIRFLFEEDYCKLHISGDLGELTATNFNNMRYENFKDFVNNTEYFKEKIDCMSRSAYSYDEQKAREDLIELIDDCGLREEDSTDDYLLEDETIDNFVDDILSDFDDTGIGRSGYDIASEHIPDFFEDVNGIGKESTGILDLYMLAFDLAIKQLKLR